MANDIIRPQIAAVQESRINYRQAVQIPGVKRGSCSGGDSYKGNADALIAAGIITAAQVPGQPGMPKVAATFIDGVLVTTRVRVPRGPGYLSVNRPSTGKTLHVFMGISADERTQRMKEEETQRAARLASKRPPIQPFTEAQYRKQVDDLTMMIWRLAHIEGRSDFTMFQHGLRKAGVEKLRVALNTVREIFATEDVHAVTAEYVALVSARRDDSFQNFLSLQCIAPQAGQIESGTQDRDGGDNE